MFCGEKKWRERNIHQQKLHTLRQFTDKIYYDFVCSKFLQRLIVFLAVIFLRLPVGSGEQFFPPLKTTNPTQFQRICFP